MKIKKVDDKPMVIHTKQKAKSQMHEPKQASIQKLVVFFAFYSLLKFLSVLRL